MRYSTRKVAELFDKIFGATSADEFVYYEVVNNTCRSIRNPSKAERAKTQRHSHSHCPASFSLYPGCLV